MAGSFEFFVAARYLKAKRKQAVISIITVISVIGVAAGVMALVIALAVNNGFSNTLQKSLLGAYAHINVLEKQPGYGIGDWHALVKKFARLPHVVAVSPALYGTGFVYTSRGNGIGVLKGIETGREVQANDILLHLKSGSLQGLASAQGERPGIILGATLAEKLDAKAGSEVTFLIPNVIMTPTGGMRPNSQKFRVIGTFESGFDAIDSAWAFTSLPAAQSLMDLQDVVNSIEIKLDDVYRAPAVKEEVRRAAGPALEPLTWMEQNRHILNALAMERQVTFLTIGLIVLVAALNILITLIMMVMEKNRDISILVSMGARQQQIRRIFMYQGVLIGVIGTAIGLTVGHVLCFFADKYRWMRLDADVYALSFVPFEPRWIDSVWVAALAILISFVATIYPARSAASITPVESLRYE